MQKQKLLIAINNFTRGGAEMLLVGILPELNERYDVVLVTLTDECEFDAEKIICKERYVLHFKNKISFISAVIKLKRIIRKVSPDIVHAHLFYSSLAARLACPARIPLLYSVHNELSKNLFNENRLYSFLEKITRKKSHAVIAVSKLVLYDYENAIGSVHKKFILRNYISDEYFLNEPLAKKSDRNRPLKLIAVGNLKESKNYEYMVGSFMHLDRSAVSLDIYGNYNDHALYPKLKSFIEENTLPVVFKGQAFHISDIFKQYDLYVMSSKYEGFGIAAVEAMACGLPALLADIPVLREVSCGEALFFDIENPLALANLVNQVLAGEFNLDQLSAKGIELAKKYGRQKYIEELFLIYDKVIQKS
jgi:glycosyltransferase involved in cell wall biosynthesis